MPDYTVPAVLFVAVDENENLVPLPAHAVKVRVLHSQQVLDLVTDAAGVSPQTTVTLIHGALPPRATGCLFMIEHAGIGASIIRSLEEFV